MSKRLSMQKDVVHGMVNHGTKHNGIVVVETIEQGRVAKSYIMHATQLQQMLRDLDAMVSTVEEEYPQEDERWKLARAIRTRWLP